MTPATLVIAASTPASSFRVTCVSPAPCVSPVVGSVSYVVGSRTAVFTPAASLVAGQTYTATITTAATDLAGNLLLSPVTVPVLPQVLNPWNFTTAAADTTAPILSSTVPVNGDANVLVNQTISATFNETMNTASVVSAFTLTGPAGPVLLRLVGYDPITSIATFNPNSDLAPGAYTATITNAATDLAGNALVVPPAGGLPVPNPWSFTVPAPIVPPPALAINLRSAASFGIASRAGLTSTGVTVVNGDVALYPLATCTDSTGNAGASQTCLVQPAYASLTGMTVNGSIYWAADPFDNGGTANAVTNDLVIAWTEGMNKVDTLAGSLLGELGAPGPVGKTLLPGVYNEANLGFAAGSVATFDALDNPDAIFIIKVGTIGGAGDFVDSGTLLLPTEIKLTRGAQARNIWFVVGRDITIGSGTTWNGNILAGRSAVVNNGSMLNGRVLAGASGAGAFVLTGAASPSVTTITVP